MRLPIFDTVKTVFNYKDRETDIKVHKRYNDKFSSSVFNFRIQMLGFLTEWPETREELRLCICPLFVD